MNQATQDLGRMSFGILQTFLTRMSALGLIDKLPQINNILRQFQVKKKDFEAVEYTIVEEERPPMISFPEYREKRGLPEPKNGLIWGNSKSHRLFEFPLVTTLSVTKHLEVPLPSQTDF